MGIPELPAQPHTARGVARFHHPDRFADQRLGPGTDPVAAQEAAPEEHLPHLDYCGERHHRDPDRRREHEDGEQYRDREQHSSRMTDVLCLEREHVRPLRIDATLEYVEISGLDGVEALTAQQL
jgi:hypothetical protein